jgi:hypothetical protein
MYECGRRSGVWIAIITEGHCRDKTADHSEDVHSLAVRKNGALKRLDELMHPDSYLVSVFHGHCNRFDMGIELTPLSSPVGADLFFANHLTALGRFRPAPAFSNGV